MANHKSAEKRARQTLRRTARNQRIDSALKTFEKNLVKSITSKAKDTPELLKRFMAEAMKAVSKGVLKKSTAARKISRVSTRAAAVK